MKRKRILTLELHPGDKVPETAIAKDLGISRTPVRDALRKLEADGLVNIYPNRFIEVATYDEKDIANLGVMRVAVDTMAVRLAIFRGSDEKEAVHLVTEHLAEFYKIRDYFPFIVKEPIIE